MHFFLLENELLFSRVDYRRVFIKHFLREVSLSFPKCCGIHKDI